ncbi:DUF7373 family lipoprotein [Corynebacterium aquatimens]|uniref:DUF7373 domain-containing protein n=1 Tax=Corynebacterium aquatimens TaxID=1190508 RepID=A0A931GSG6_9CORY|nr:hypothetical protein [Corynebacterium aquatimens]MBG6123043.1 hypothetical protein [Corynebacterium aquatimens]
MTSFVVSASLILGLSACSSDSDREETSTSAAPPSSAAAEPVLETGEYKAEAHEPWKKPYNEDLGRTSSSYELAENVLLPMEIDQDLYKTALGGQYAKLEHLSRTFGDAVRDAVTPFEDNYEYGFQQVANNEKADRRGTNTVLRLSNPDTANEVANAIHQALLTSGLYLESLNEVNPNQPTQIAGMPDTLASIGLNDHSRKVYAITPHNEYVIISIAEDSGKEFAESDWQDEYNAEFLEEQTPLIDEIKATRTKDGFGATDERPDIDPTGVLRLTVFPDKNDKYLLPVGAITQRVAASYFKDAQSAWATLRQAGVERAGWNVVQLYPTKNNEAPNVIQSWARSSAAEGEIKDYDEPQGVPNTTCYSSDDESWVSYTCMLIFDNYIAISSTEDWYDKPEDDDAKERLSHRMAAQYLILKKEAEGSTAPSTDPSTASSTEGAKENEESESPSKSSSKSSNK